MAHRNARLTIHTRLDLVQQVEDGWLRWEVARQFRVSRATVAKWLRRYREEGEAGLEDRSSAPNRRCSYRRQAARATFSWARLCRITKTSRAT